MADCGLTDRPLAATLGHVELSGQDAADRRSRARIAALTRWSREEDRTAATAPARRGLDARFAREIDPQGKLTPQELAVRVAAARRAHFLKLALRSAQVRRRRSAGAA